MSDEAAAAAEARLVDIDALRSELIAERAAAATAAAAAQSREAEVGEELSGAVRQVAESTARAASQAGAYTRPLFSST